MKASKAAVFFVLLAVLALLALLSLPTFAAPDELLVNGGFEEGIDPWRASGCTIGRTGDPDLVNNGNFAAVLSTEGYKGWMWQVVQVQPEEAYAFTGYVIRNDENISAIFLQISFLRGGVPLGSYASPSLEGNTAKYRPISLSATAPPEADSARVEAWLERCTTAIGPATAYLDDMSFTGPPPLTSTPTPAPISSPTPTLTATPTPTPMPSTTLTATPTPTPTGTTADRGDVLINELLYNPPQTGPDADYEWVELFNRANETIHLEGWRIRDNQDSDLIPSITLSPHSFAVIAAREEGFGANFPNFDGNIVFLDGSIGNGLSNDGDCIILEDSEGKVIDELSYGSDNSRTPHCRGVAEGHSLERSPAGGEFVDNPNPTPGYGLSPAATPTPAETPVETATPTPAETPIITPPGGADSEPAEASAFSGPGVRAILIVLAIAFFGIVFWMARRRRP